MFLVIPYWLPVWLVLSLFIVISDFISLDSNNSCGIRGFFHYSCLKSSHSYHTTNEHLQTEFPCIGNISLEFCTCSWQFSPAFSMWPLMLIICDLYEHQDPHSAISIIYLRTILFWCQYVKLHTVPSIFMTDQTGNVQLFEGCKLDWVVAARTLAESKKLQVCIGPWNQTMKLAAELAS